MWYLISVENPEFKFVLLSGKEYVIGRKDCDIIIPGDQTVSRKHASIKVMHTEANVPHPHKLPLITLKDLSKYGSIVNKSKVKGEAVLNDGDELIFGSIKSTYLVVYEPFIITTSCLENVAKKQLKSIVCKLGGHIANEWRRDCSMLVMNNISVTIKVICAMVSLKPIVSPDYIEALVKSLETGSDVNLNPDDYLPNVVETQITHDEVSFHTDERRKSIFQGMKFIFLDPKQFKKMSIAVELAGGMPMLMEEGCDQGERTLIEKGSVVMTCASDDTTLTQDGREWVEHVRKYLKRHKKNMILEAELGYAVLYCSTDRHCNPNIDTASELLMQVPSQTLSQQPAYTDSEILAVDTERPDLRKRAVIQSDISVVDQTTLEETKKKSKISPSVSPARNEQQLIQSKPVAGSSRTEKNSKRLRDDDGDEEYVVGKKIKQELLTPPDDRVGGRQRRVNDNEDASLSAMVATASSDKEKTLSAKHTTVKMEDSSDDDLFSDSKKNKSKKSSPVRSPRRVSRSPSPSTRSSTRIAEKRQSPTPAVVSEPKIRVKDSPSTMSDKRKSPSEQSNVGGRGSPSPSRSPNPTEAKVSVFKQIPWKTKQIIEDDDFDQIISTHDVKGEEDESHKSKVHRKRQISPSSRILDSPSPDRSSPVRTSAKKSHASLSSQLPTSDKTSSKPAYKTSRRHSPSPVRKETKELHSDEDSDVQETKPLVSTRFTDAEIPDGFLSTRIQDTRGDAIKSEEYENDQPSNLIITEFKSLICRQPRKISKSSRDGAPEGYVKWKGKLVKNFKKFKKTQHLGANSLPRIIGGSDLHVHINIQSRAIDDFSQVESEVSESDRLAQKFFNWDSDSKKGKRSR